MMSIDDTDDAKVGNFDWIVEYEDMEPFFQPSYTHITEPKSSQKVVVIGCGTSLVSERLAASGFGYVLSVDNDKG